jgi:predicted enzyme related to lactoylglutathione lyase
MTGELTFFEIGVVDAAPARAFYGGLFGWWIEPGPSAGGYRISTPTISGGMHGGDETLESRTDEPREESFGRFALCRYDQGSPFGLHQPPAAEGKGAREPAARRPTIDHVTLRVRDLPASRRFYEAALAPLSLGLEFEHEGLIAFGSGESGRLIIYASGPSPGSMSLSPLPAGRP